MDLALAAPERSSPRPIIEKEILHYDILFCLKEAGLLDRLTFQGGTSLRLCYGSQRFSEDLDFAWGKDFNREKMEAIKSCIEGYIHQRYALPVLVYAPEKVRVSHQDLHGDTWQVKITTHPERKDLPRQVIKIEIATIEAYSKEPKFLQANYHFLPDSYMDLFLLVESRDEIMTDKIVALVNTETDVRHRDLWDLRFLEEVGARHNLEWLQRKVEDYQIKDFPQKELSMMQRLEGLIEGPVFLREMQRFLPRALIEKTLQVVPFRKALLFQLQSLLDKVLRQL